MRALLPVAALLTLAACGDKPAPPPEPLKGGKAAPGEGIRHMFYACADGTKAQASYGRNAAGQANVTLTFRGKTGQLTEFPAASGAKYSAENLLEPDKLLIWWEKNGEATVMESLLDDSAKPEDARTLTTCKLTAPPA
ncbi:MliC family protein [Sandaracinobacteroides saxicola]|uniref:MliC family protein n=1 Tax=Sandaracinobacteroides saxicola TaxID=2759707 RepID=A0A7G5IFX8_9SPHN|nr:MliC family protein [Sandaracinobacteroides saxicola]QMW22270.1 MliC family protein [Sandaracinobacteroides saxicola]